MAFTGLEDVLLETLASGRVQMAAEMRLSVKTVETHQKHIREKLRLRDGAELQRRATIFHTARATNPAAE